VKNVIVHTMPRKCWLNICGKNWEQKINYKEINKFPKGLTILEFRFLLFLVFVILRNTNIITML
jgi:hypothetical protein